MNLNNIRKFYHVSGNLPKKGMKAIIIDDTIQISIFTNNFGTNMIIDFNKLESQPKITHINNIPFIQYHIDSIGTMTTQIIGNATMDMKYIKVVIIDTKAAIVATDVKKIRITTKLKKELTNNLNCFETNYAIRNIQVVNILKNDEIINEKFRSA